jgi:hypothetical protein
MGFSHGYGPGVSDDEAIDLMRKAFDLGCTFYDTAEGYAAGENERLVGRALVPIRDEVVIATKFFIGGHLSRDQLGREIREHLDASLDRLGTDHVELYYQHRVPDSIPVADVAAVMGELIAEGKILGWGQSQATEEQIRRAHVVAPLTAIQSEYSIMERMFEKDVIPALRGARDRVRTVQSARQRIPVREGHGERDVYRRRRPAGHHPVRQRQHPCEPAPAGPTHRIREGEGRHSGTDLFRQPLIGAGEGSRLRR